MMQSGTYLLSAGLLQPATGRKWGQCEAGGFITSAHHGTPFMRFEEVKSTFVEFDAFNLSRADDESMW